MYLPSIIFADNRTKHMNMDMKKKTNKGTFNPV